MRIDSEDNIYFLMSGYMVIKLDSTGQEEWNTGEISEFIQFNDLELASDGLVLVGHKYSL